MSDERFIKKPNLPENDVTLCVCSDSDTARLLASCGITVLKTKPTPYTQPEVSRHADMQMCHLGGADIVADKFQTELTDELKRHGFNIITDVLTKPNYPDEICFNAAICGGYLFGLQRFLSRSLKNRAEKSGLKLVNIRQGYAKCSVCTVAEKAIITDDSGIAQTAAKLGFDVLEIGKGDIYLSDSHYGFIGGCSGKISKDKVVFTGSLDSHSSGRQIRAFLQAHGCNAIELTQDRLKDVGGILPVKEEKKCIHSESTSEAPNAP